MLRVMKNTTCFLCGPNSRCSGVGCARGFGSVFNGLAGDCARDLALFSVAHAIPQLLLLMHIVCFIFWGFLVRYHRRAIFIREFFPSLTKAFDESQFASSPPPPRFASSLSHTALEQLTITHLSSCDASCPPPFVARFIFHVFMSSFICSVSVADFLFHCSPKFPLQFLLKFSHSHL